MLELKTHHSTHALAGIDMWLWSWCQASLSFYDGCTDADQLPGDPVNLQERIRPPSVAASRCEILAMEGVQVEPMTFMDVDSQDQGLGWDGLFVIQVCVIH